MKKILIIGVGWEQIPMVIKAKKRGLYVIITTWWDKKRIPADKIYEADSRDLEKIDKIICMEKPDYITADECDYSMYAVSFFAEKYHLYGPRLRTQTITNNKYLQRKYVSQTDVLQPEYKLCWNLEMAYDFANQIGYPVIVKPIDNRGSIGITKVFEDEKFSEAWLLAVSNSFSRVCIVEKCINGEVITADGFHNGKKFEFIAASNKEMYPENDNVAKILYYPGEFASDLFEKIRETSEIISESIGVDFGFIHTEFIVELETNDLYFIEVANRGGGVYISNIVLREITNIDYCEALLDMAMGKEISISYNQNYFKKAALYFVNLTGKIPVNQCANRFDKHYLVVHINACRENSNVKSEASVGRQGVLICSGNTREEIKYIGEKFEKSYAAIEDEYLWIRGGKL